MTVRCCSRTLLLTLLGGAAFVGQSGGHLVAETCRPAQGQRAVGHENATNTIDTIASQFARVSLPWTGAPSSTPGGGNERSPDRCGGRMPPRPGTSKPTPGNPGYTRETQSRDMRNALVKSFMCDHYSKTMHWAATDRDPARYGIRGRSEYWLHRPSPTFQHREQAFFLLVAERKRENGMGSDHRTTSLAVDKGHAPPQRMARQRQSRACSSGTSKTSIKASQQSSDTTMERSGLRT